MFSTLRLLPQKLAARGLMQTRHILRQSPRHGDGKVLDGGFTESGSWATVLEPLRYKIAEPEVPTPRSPSAARSPSPDSSTPSSVPKKPAYPSSPREIEEALKAVRVVRSRFASCVSSAAIAAGLFRGVE
jgi:hypothetical protein